MFLCCFNGGPYRQDPITVLFPSVVVSKKFICICLLVTAMMHVVVFLEKEILRNRYQNLEVLLWGAGISSPISGVKVVWLDYINLPRLQILAVEAQCQSHLSRNLNRFGMLRKILEVAAAVRPLLILECDVLCLFCESAGRLSEAWNQSVPTGRYQHFYPRGTLKSV